jgi:CubicO group peptidase (beta-lactamase class C family)
VCISPAEFGNLESVVQFGWGGAACTWVIIDPREELVALVFAQHVFNFDFISWFQTVIEEVIVKLDEDRQSGAGAGRTSCAWDLL